MGGIYKVVLLSLFALFVFQISPWQTSGQPDAGVQSVREISQVHVTLELRGRSDGVFVPYCGEAENGDPELCTLGVRIERYTKTGWVKVQASGELGGAAIGRAGWKRIEPGQRARFDYFFRKAFFQVSRGERLRLVIKTWRSMDSMKAYGPSLEMSTDSFLCP